MKQRAARSSAYPYEKDPVSPTGSFFFCAGISLLRPLGVRPHSRTGTARIHGWAPFLEKSSDFSPKYGGALLARAVVQRQTPFVEGFCAFGEMFSGLQGPCSDAAGANPLLPWHTSVIFLHHFHLTRTVSLSPADTSE